MIRFRVSQNSCNSTRVQYLVRYIRRVWELVRHWADNVGLLVLVRSVGGPSYVRYSSIERMVRRRFFFFIKKKKKKKKKNLYLSLEIVERMAINPG